MKNGRNNPVYLTASSLLKNAAKNSAIIANETGDDGSKYKYWEVRNVHNIELHCITDDFSFAENSDESTKSVFISVLKGAKSIVIKPIDGGYGDVEVIISL